MRGWTEGCVAVATLAGAKHRGTVSTVYVEINRTWSTAAEWGRNQVTPPVPIDSARPVAGEHV